MQKDKSKRIKGLLILVVFILSITGLASWYIWAQNTPATDQEDQQVFNTKLPDAQIRETSKNKLEIYMQAEKDSAKLAEQQKKEAMRNWINPIPLEDAVYTDDADIAETKKTTARYSKNSIAVNEKKVNDRLEKLYAAINDADVRQQAPVMSPNNLNTSKYDTDIAQLEKLLGNLHTSGSDADPEIKQLETMLDKLLDIQHPERVKERMAKSDNNPGQPVFDVTTGETISKNVESETDALNGFFGLDQEISFDAAKNETTILAVVHQDQVLQDGSVIKLRLLQDIFVNNSRIPKDNFIYGECNLGDQRLFIRFNSIAFHNTIYPVKLTAFDTDGNEGIYIPGAISRDAAKAGLDDAVQQLQIATLNPSVAAQAATAGIQAAQNLIRKKIKRVRVTVKAGHQLLLKMK